jgi:para-nitrobenzyl esterase
VRGVRSDGVIAFKGIPYGGSVSGANRFKAPPRPTPWKSVLDATEFGIPAIQAPSASMGPAGGGRMPLPGENCLVLNVWTPAADNKRRPVMFYNHGGGFLSGSGSALSQDGSRLAQLYDVVVVQSNHRLALLGYLYLRDILGDDYPGNAGLLDIGAALRWTAENIAHFGCDPDNVMVFGESGGGAKTSCVFAMPALKDLLHKASIESGPGIRMTPAATASDYALAALRELGLSRATVAKIFEVPAAELLRVQMKLNAESPQSAGGVLASRIDFSPVVDGVILPTHPFDPVAPAFSASKPLMCGTCKDETVFFYRDDKAAFALDDAGLRDRMAKLYGADAEAVIATFRASRPAATPSQLFIAITTAATLVDGEILIAERKLAQRAAPVYMYQLSYESPEPVPGTNYPMGSPHASDIFMKFNNADAASPSMLSLDRRPGRFATAKNMSEMWATVARSGKPGARGQPDWPAYTLERRATMLIAENCRVDYDPHPLEREFWAKRRSARV